jgi:hypothetical protein
MAKGQKPVILPEYNLTQEDDEVYDFSGYFDEAIDTSYIPGYSDIVKANEIAAVPDHTWYEQYKDTGITKQSVLQKIGVQPQPLPVRFLWLRTQSVGGLPDAEVAKQLMEYTGRRKYRPAIYPGDFEPYGFGFPPAGHKEADGTIRRDDVTLYVVVGRAADAFDKALADYTHKLENPESRRVDDDSEIEVNQNKRERREIQLTT